MTKILIAEDEPDIRELVAFMLRFAGYEVVTASNGEEAVQGATREIPDLILMDVRMPRMTGYEACRIMKASPTLQDIPVVFLSAKGQESEIQSGLDAGADDYLVKPFDLPELSARLRALVRRRAGRRAPQIELGALTIDPMAREVRLAGNVVELTPHEYALVVAFAEQPRRVLSRRQLEDTIHTLDSSATSNVVEVYVSRLRRKFGSEAIRTVRGFGYRWGNADAGVPGVGE